MPRPGSTVSKSIWASRTSIVAFVGDAEILVTHLAPLSAAMMDRLPKLEFVAVSRGGPVNIDMQAARERRHHALSTRPDEMPVRSPNSRSAGSWRKRATITRGHDALREGKWRGNLYRADMAGEELSEMTVGVIGYGAIGTRVVKLLQAFGCRILVCDPYVQLAPQDRADGVTRWRSTDCSPNPMSSHCTPRVTAETTGMIDRDALARMKKGAYFINTARGPMVDYDALYDALRSQHLRGAMLETFAVEPPPANWPLLRLENVTLTPHIAGASLKTVRIAGGASG